jgi:dTMP kinase
MFTEKFLMTRRGKFITLEGPEGGGKSTHARALVERLTAEHYPALAVREPGGTAAGEAIRRLLQQNPDGEPICQETELFLFLASRAQLVRQVIRPALEKGVHVICDRFADSTFAYQGAGRGLELDRLIAVNDLAVQGLLPDLTLLLDIPIAAGFERVQARNAGDSSRRDRIERESADFHERVRAGFLELARRWPDRIRRIDTSTPVTEVREEIWRLVKHVLDC